MKVNQLCHSSGANESKNNAIATIFFLAAILFEASTMKSESEKLLTNADGESGMKQGAVTALCVENGKNNDACCNPSLQQEIQ